jgi:catechol 2,3-dioxygenase-like lactoylglutathione lyase family enzyme
MRVIGLDHLVLTVADIQRTVDFYTQVLGMSAETFGPDQRTALRFGTHKINLHQRGHEFEPKAERPTPGSADLCFLVAGFTDLPAHLSNHGVTVLEGPVMRTGAQGQIASYYIRDPDQNLIELSHYP